MAAGPSGTMPGVSDGQGDSGSIIKMEALLEQLRSKHRSRRSSDSWNEFAKQIRMASLDVNQQFRDKAVIHESLEKLQSLMTASNVSQVLERINGACRKLGLKYSEQGSTVYISTDLFYIDLQCDTASINQSVKDVRVTHHGTQPTSVPAMIQALRQGNVSLFMAHIKGYMDMYNLESEQPLKTKFFIVQQSLETDIDKINKVQRQQSIKNNVDLGSQIHKGALGLVQPRNGGLPTKLTFFLTPYDFLNEKGETSYPMTNESIKNYDLGFSAIIGIEQTATSHQLQTIPLMNFSRIADNRMGTQFVQCTNINSVMMPAAFILKFKKPIALSQEVIQQIEKMSGSCAFSESLVMKPLLEAMVESTGVSVPPGTNHFTVVLPGQVQNYYINDLKNNDEPIYGALVAKLPFKHPTFLPAAISLLRQQLMLNTMILSCVRSGSGSKSMTTKALNMELKVLSNQLLTATFQDPYTDGVATVDIDITDVSLPKGSLYCAGRTMCTNNFVSKVIQRSYSIPVMLRAILHQAGHQEENLPPPTKKVKADHGQIMQTISSVYTARGHYIPYGSVNTSSTSYTKNIETNKYRLCLRRFSGYKRSCFTALNPINSLPIAPTKTHPTVINLHPIPTQASDKNKLSTTPMLSSLLDDKDNTLLSDLKPPAYPLSFEPAQGHPPQQFSVILTDLLQEPEGPSLTDKKPKPIRKKRRTSEGNSLPPTASVTTPGIIKKRKKSDNEEIVRELTSRVKSEATEQQGLMAAVSLPQTVKIKSEFGMVTSSYGLSSTISRPTVAPRQTSDGSQLAQLLQDIDGDKKSKPIVKTVADLFESPRHMKQEALHADVKVPISTNETIRVKKEERKIVKHVSSTDSLPKDKKLKRSDSVETKVKESKSFDQIPLSPGKKTISNKASVKLAKSKSAQAKLDSNVPSLTIKPHDDRGSPKEKVKKQGSEKKKRPPKTPPVFVGGADAAGKQAILDSYKMGFYGANDLKSLPKIPKRKPGESQPSPTSPTPPNVQQKSPVLSDWQRSSPVPNRSLQSNKSEEAPSAAIVNRLKSFPSTYASGKRPALLPTPGASPQKPFQRKTEVVQRQANTAAYTPQSSGFQPPRYSNSNLQVKGQRVDPSPNSPDELSVVVDSTQPVYIPTQPIHNDPTSPTPELITHAPKAIPLDPNKAFGVASVVSYSSSSASSKPVLVKQKAVSRLACSPKSISDARI